ncbi:hypothetical protein AAC387_Pa03g3315 [Persea americana]
MPSMSGERRTVRPPQVPEHLPCPRCESTNTKFCYYNNYNLSQPRHFCKSCRRYWTQGGTLRNIPVGGGSRKNSSTKRSRLSSDTTPATVSSVPVSCSETDIWALQDPISIDVPGRFSFSSLLGESFFSLGGELGVGVEELGNWPPGDVDMAAGATWQVGSDVGHVEGDCYAWPELMISTAGKSFV